MAEHEKTEQKIELSREQISILLQIINKTSVAGEQVELVANLKQTLVMMARQLPGPKQG